MKKTVLSIFFTIALVTGLSLNMQAQTTSEAVKDALKAACAEHLVNLTPPSGCECNNCDMNFDDAIKITKTTKRGSELLVWGKARTTYKDPYTEGKNSVQILATCKKDDMGEVYVSMLKWKKSDCMKYVTLIQP